MTSFAELLENLEEARSGAGKTERKENARKFIMICMVGFHSCYKFRKKRCRYISCIHSG